MLNKAGGKPFKCEQCSYSSNRSFDLRRHKKRHTRIKPLEGTVFKCSECSFLTKWKRNMGRHMEIHNRTPADNHSFDDLVEPVEDSVGDPVDDTEDEETFEELIVELIQDTGSSREIEESSVKRMKVFVCGQCHYTTSRAVDLRRHEQTHSRVKIIDGTAFKCMICPFITKWKRNMVRHTKKHVNLCTEQLDNRSSEELIVELVKSDDLRSDYDTDAVDNSQSSVLNRNSPPPIRNCYSPNDADSENQMPQATSEAQDNKANGEKRFKCTQCHYESKRAFDLRRHEQRHTRVKVVDGTAIKCPECSFVTKWKRNMTRHMRLHKPKDTPAETSILDEQLSELEYDVEFQSHSIEPLDSETIISNFNSETIRINELNMGETKSEVEIEFLLSDEDPDVLPSYWHAIEQDEESVFGS
ncbi:hypothetical protein ACLKA7_012300 [Drosophila subpalustris]